MYVEFSAPAQAVSKLNYSTSRARDTATILAPTSQTYKANARPEHLDRVRPPYGDTL